MSQKRAVQEALFGFAVQGKTAPETTEVVDRVLSSKPDEFGGQTPRNSVRRTLSELQSDGLVIKDGRGHLRIQMGALVDCVVHGDVLSLLRLCPDNTLPVVLADPAWGYMLTHASRGTTTRMVGSATRWFETSDLPEPVIQEIARVLRPGGVFLCWLPPLQDAAEAQWEVPSTVRRAGLRCLREVTWDKGKGPGYGWAPSSEPCFVFYKGERPKFYDLGVTNVLRHPRLSASQKTQYADFSEQDQAAWDQALAKHESAAQIPGHERARLKERSHGCEKPVPMLMELLRPVLGPGPHGKAPEGSNLVVDLYAGSGSGSVAARRLGAHFLAVEIDERNVEQLILPRLGNAVRCLIRLLAQEAEP